MMSIQKRSKKTRSKIIRSGQVCFSRHGYDGTGVAEICKEAGISKGAFYHHFPSKQELYLTILEEWLGDLNEVIPGFVEAGETIPEAFRRMSQLVPVVFELAEGQLPVMFDFWARSALEPEIFERTVKPLEAFEGLFAGYIERGILGGSIRSDIDSEFTARVLISMVVGVLLQGLLAPDVTDWGKVAFQGVDWIFRSIGKESD